MGSCAWAYLRVLESFSYASLFTVDLPVSPTLPGVSEQSEQLPEDSQLKDIRDALYSLWGRRPGCCFLLLHWLLPHARGEHTVTILCKNLTPLSTFNIISDTQGQSSSEVLNRKFQKQFKSFKLCLLESILLKLISSQLIL